MKKLYMILWIALILAQAGLGDDQLLVMDPIEYDGPGHVPDEIIVKFKPGVGRSEIAKINSQHGTSVIYTSPFAGFKRFKIPKGLDAAKMVEILSKNPNVEYAELNYIAYAFLVPNDKYYSYQWHLDNPVYGGIGMEEAWDLSSGAGVTVAVIDTGVADSPSEDDLEDSRVVGGYDFVNNDSDPTDDNGHGTHVAGTIAQSTNNWIGVAGVAYDCTIMPVKVLNKRGSGTYAGIADGIYYAADNGAEVINMSLGGPYPSTTLETALAYAYQQGVTIICASGNDGSSQVSYPARYDAYCIAVGATTYNEAVASYSNGGDSLDLTAPGGDGGYGGVLQQTFQRRTWGYYFFSGTSMAAPHVSGVATLLISKGVATIPDDVREALESTAEDKGAPGLDSEYGWGIVNAYAALQWVSGTVDNPPTVTITSPLDGATVLGTVILIANASDDNGVVQVEFFVDGYSVGKDTNASGGWSVTWVTTSNADGSYTVSATAMDTENQTTDSDSINVTVDNIDSFPIVALVNPSSDDVTVSGIIEVTADAVDDRGIAQVEFFVNSSSIGVDDDGSDGWSVPWDTTTYDDGSYTVSATAMDTGGNTDSDSIYNVKVDNSTPEQTMRVVSIEMSIKTAGRNVNAKATITILATDGVTLVAGATVYGHWSGATSDNDVGTTDTLGKVTLQSDKIKNTTSGTIFTFTVDNVDKSDWDYVPSSNLETSDSIVVP